MHLQHQQSRRQPSDIKLLWPFDRLVQSFAIDADSCRLLAQYASTGNDPERMNEIGCVAGSLVSVMTGAA